MLRLNIFGWRESVTSIITSIGSPPLELKTY